MLTGSNLSIGHLDCKDGQATVATVGGQNHHISIGGIDGPADIRSSGGTVSLQLHERANNVQAHSQGGDIDCCVSPEVVARGLLVSAVGRQVECSCEGLHALTEGVQAVSGQSRARGLRMLRVTYSSQMAMGNSKNACHVNLNAMATSQGTLGFVRIRQQSWIEAAKAKVKS